jgi:hypothetical protein
VELGGSWDNTTATNQTYNTLSYSKSYTTSTTNTLTNGWNVGWKGVFPFKVKPESLLSSWTMEFNVGYSGSYATAKTTSTTISINQPSQPIIVPPGCHIDAAIYVYEATIDTDYTAYGSVDGHLQYVMSTPWKNMTDTSVKAKSGTNKPRNKYTKFGRTGLLPW